MQDTGIVIIGRNEGQRLPICIESVGANYPVIYVDSGSTDGSPEIAKKMGATVWQLDPSLPFSAARARNEGYAQLMRSAPGVRFVQFLDGDCIMDPQWLSKASEAFANGSDLAIVCGRLRERFRDRSIYNRLCDIEFDTPSGLIEECGGILLMESKAFLQAGGFNSQMIAGEEPELCVRLRQAGWKIRRIDAEMARHDAAILSFSAWWKRVMRGGYAAAIGASMHGSGPEHHRIDQVRSALLWGGILPLIAIVAAWPTQGWSLGLLVVYPLQWLRLFYRQFKRSKSLQDAIVGATFRLVGKFPELYGMIKFVLHRWRGRKGVLIEYKTGAVSELVPTVNK
jgi:GT2 family glycosyltransferase